MKSLSTTLAVAFCACALALAPAEAKKKPQSDEQQQQEQPQSEAPPRYTPFPHNLIFNLVDIDGKAPPREMWLRIDFDRGAPTARRAARTGRGCSSWVRIGSGRAPCRPSPNWPAIPRKRAYEQQFWAILLNGPFWDLKGDQLIIKAFKGPGVMHFQRSL